MSDDEQLIRMANDIGNFFRAYPNREQAVAGIENHIKSFWTRRMRRKLKAQLDAGREGLDDLPREALLRLESHPDSKPQQRPGGDAG